MNVWSISRICAQHDEEQRLSDADYLREQKALRRAMRDERSRLAKHESQARERVSGHRNDRRVGPRGAIPKAKHQAPSTSHQAPAPHPIYTKQDLRLGHHAPRDGSTAHAVLQVLSQLRTPARLVDICDLCGPEHSRKNVSMALNYLVKCDNAAHEGPPRRYRFLITLTGLERLTGARTSVRRPSFAD